VGVGVALSVGLGLDVGLIVGDEWDTAVEFPHAVDVEARLIAMAANTIRGRHNIDLIVLTVFPRRLLRVRFEYGLQRGAEAREAGQAPLPDTSLVISQAR
jgi:hypothetical protein